MWTRTINIFPEKEEGDTSLRITILDANKDRPSSNADTSLVNTSLLRQYLKPKKYLTKYLTVIDRPQQRKNKS